MAKYEISIDGGEGGEKIIVAENLDAAKKEAVAWAKAGDWPQDRGDLWADVYVCNIDDEEDSELISAQVAGEEVA